MKPIPLQNNLPPGFYQLIEPYISSESPKQITGRSELVGLWQQAIRYYREHPEKKEAIAEWTMSAGASSPLIDQDPQLHEIHFTFGELELPEAHVFVKPGESVDDRWNQLADLITEANTQG